MNEKVQYWVELSDYDIKTAEAMLLTERYLYVGFMCHQTIEKILKGYYSSKFDSSPPYTHSLSYLAEKCMLIDEFDEEQKDFINMMEPMNIEARYPAYKQKLF